MKTSVRRRALAGLLCGALVWQSSPLSAAALLLPERIAPPGSGAMSAAVGTAGVAGKSFLPVLLRLDAAALNLNLMPSPGIAPLPELTPLVRPMAPANAAALELPAVVVPDIPHRVRTASDFSSQPVFLQSQSVTGMRQTMRGGPSFDMGAAVWEHARAQGFALSQKRESGDAVSADASDAVFAPQLGELAPETGALKSQPSRLIKVLCAAFLGLSARIVPALSRPATAAVPAVAARQTHAPRLFDLAALARTRPLSRILNEMRQISLQAHWDRWLGDIEQAALDQSSKVSLALDAKGRVIGFQILTNRYFDEGLGQDVVFPGAIYGAYLTTRRGSAVNGIGKALFLEQARLVYQAGFTEMITHIKKGNAAWGFFEAMAKYVPIKSRTEDPSYVRGEEWIRTAFDVTGIK